MEKMNPRPSGETGGKDLPDRGVTTGVTDTYGGNLQQGYNDLGRINGHTTSDPAEQTRSKCPDIKRGR